MHEVTTPGPLAPHSQATFPGSTLPGPLYAVRIQMGEHGIPGAGSLVQPSNSSQGRWRLRSPVTVLTKGVAPSPAHPPHGFASHGDAYGWQWDSGGTPALTPA